MRLGIPPLRKSLGSIGLGAVLVLTPPSMASQEFQIRARVDLVVVPVTVKGDGGRLLTGLTQDDFILREDGRLQTITNFTSDPVPLSAVVLVDSALSPRSFETVQQSFTALAGSFSDFDEIAVYRFDNRVVKLIDFTTDRLVAEAALKTLEEIKPLPLPTASGGPFSTPGPVINGIPVAPSAQPGARIPPQNFKVLHDAIFRATLDLEKRPPDRRRLVFVISDGRARGNEYSYEETIERLLAAGVQVYGVGMDLGFFTRQLSVLDSYADDTGGDTFFLNSIHALEAAYARTTEQARNQYVLGYVSNNEVQGTEPVFRRIEVKTARADAEILHRQGYYQAP